MTFRKIKLFSEKIKYIKVIYLITLLLNNKNIKFWLILLLSVNKLLKTYYNIIYNIDNI